MVVRTCAAAPSGPFPRAAGVPTPGGLETAVGDLPRDVGAAFLVLGAIGMVIPGPVPPGISFVAVATAILWPGLVRPWERWLRRRFPAFHRRLVAQIERFRTSLERRYPLVAR
jgi:hypothetical protein